MHAFFAQQSQLALIQIDD